MLQNLALLKLGSTLAAFDLSSPRVRDIVELTKYTFANTMSYKDHTDELRSLVVDYIVCHVELIAVDDAFRQFVQEEGPFAFEVLIRLLERLD